MSIFSIFLQTAVTISQWLNTLVNFIVSSNQRDDHPRLSNVLMVLEKHIQAMMEVSIRGREREGERERERERGGNERKRESPEILILQIGFIKE